MLCRSILLLSLSIAVSANDESSPFSFVVLSDIHSFTELSFKPFDDTLSVWIQGKKILKNIKDKTMAEESSLSCQEMAPATVIHPPLIL
eukprot:scaffold10171_cov446-Chaetoceros_neogracile.AAC.1